MSGESILVQMQEEIQSLEKDHETYKEKLAKIKAADSSFNDLFNLFEKKRKQITRKYQLLAQEKTNKFMKMNNGDKIIIKGDPSHKTKFNDVDHRLIERIRGDVLVKRRK